MSFNRGLVLFFSPQVGKWVVEVRSHSDFYSDLEAERRWEFPNFKAANNFVVTAEKKGIPGFLGSQPEGTIILR